MRLLVSARQTPQPRQSDHILLQIRISSPQPFRLTVSPLSFNRLFHSGHMEEISATIWVGEMLAAAPAQELSWGRIYK